MLNQTYQKKITITNVLKFMKKFMLYIGYLVDVLLHKYFFRCGNYEGNGTILAIIQR